MQNQLWIAAQQARGVDSQSEIASDAAVRIAIDQSLGLHIRPFAAHRRLLSSADAGGLSDHPSAGA